MSDHPNRPNQNNNNNDDHENGRKLWPFFFIIPILGFSFLPITGSLDNGCTTTTCYPNPSFWIIHNVTTPVPSIGTCTKSATYVEGDGGTTLTVTTPGGNNPGYNLYVLFDFDVHVNVTGTTGSVTLWETIFGIGAAPAISIEMIVNGGVANVRLHGALQAGGINLGPNTTDTFGIAILKTAGPATGAICIDEFEGEGYPFGVGGVAG